MYPKQLADRYKERAGQKWQPSNGTEGEIFFAAWCCHCMRDKAMREGCDIDECDDNEKCEIIAATMCFKPSDEEYPKEWCYDKDGQPCCTAFVREDMKIPERDDYTMDLF